MVGWGGPGHCVVTPTRVELGCDNIRLLIFLLMQVMTPQYGPPVAAEYTLLGADLGFDCP